MKCHNCGKEVKQLIFKTPSRSFISPNKSTAEIGYCSDECYKENDSSNYAYLAVFDRNASDSECFVHEKWGKNSHGEIVRIGKCNITGSYVEVAPLTPGDNSGQPIECYKHFIPRKKYISSVSSEWLNLCSKF